MTTERIEEILRTAEAQKLAREILFPDEQSVVRMMIQGRLRLEDLGWRTIENGPRDTWVEVICPGYAGPAKAIRYDGDRCWFVSSGNDLWPANPTHFRPLPPQSEGTA